MSIRTPCTFPLNGTTVIIKIGVKALALLYPIAFSIASSETDFVRRPILECQMNPPGVVEVHIMHYPEAELRQADSARQKRSVFA